MAKPYPILPLNVLDELHDLNNALQVYNLLVSAWAQQTLNGDIQGDPACFTAGLDFLFRPILEGYQSIQSQAEAFESMGVVGFCTIEDGDQEKP